MRANADPDIEVSLQRDSQPSARHLGLALRGGQRHVDVIAPLCDTQSSGARKDSTEFLASSLPFRREIAVQSFHAVQGHVGVDGIRVEALPEHQHGLLMRISGGGGKRNVSGQGDVPEIFFHTN